MSLSLSLSLLLSSWLLSSVLFPLLFLLHSLLLVLLLLVILLMLLMLLSLLLPLLLLSLLLFLSLLLSLSLSVLSYSINYINELNLLRLERYFYYLNINYPARDVVNFFFGGIYANICATPTKILRMYAFIDVDYAIFCQIVAIQENLFVPLFHE